MGYTIKQVAEKINLTAFTLRYYEKEGLLPFVERDENGYRVFDDKDIEWIKMICCLRSKGMSISEIKRFVNLCMGGGETLDSRKRIIAEHKELVENHIKQMQEYLAKINDKLKDYSINEGIDIDNPIYKTEALENGENARALIRHKKINTPMSNLVMLKDS